ncbi:hypothetical protein [Escherichia coli]|uniref:hypothetical protein n=1 Tax=Escherichia coli TaxID=562 RepID=UPI00273A4F69|nr:hypothetical protein [Escherichia coli]
MTRFYCTMQRQRFDEIMRQRTTALTLSNVATRPQPGDELEITVINPDRTTKTTITDILNRRPGSGHKRWIVSVRPRRSPEESEPRTPAGKIMQKYHEEQEHKHNAALARTLNAVNRKAALAGMVFSPQRNSSARPTQHRRTPQ